MHGDERRAGAGVEEAGDRGVEGRVDRGPARVALRLGEAGVERHLRSVADGRREVGGVARPIAVDDQPGIGLEAERGAEAVGEAARHLGGADVPGDVAGHVLGGRRPAGEMRRQRAAAVLAGQHQRSWRARSDDLDGRRVGGVEGEGVHAGPF